MLNKSPCGFARPQLRGRVSCLLLALCMTPLLTLVGCHRSEFAANLTTQCPEPDGTLVVFDYTLNCLYVGDTPEQGCPEALPNNYFYRDTYICSERAGATTGYLQAIIDTYLDIDAAIQETQQSDAGIEMNPDLSMDLAPVLSDGFLPDN